MNKAEKLKLIKEVLQEVKDSMTPLATPHLDGVESVILSRVDRDLEVNGDKFNELLNSSQ